MQDDIGGVLVGKVQNHTRGYRFGGGAQPVPSAESGMGLCDVNGFGGCCK